MKLGQILSEHAESSSEEPRAASKARGLLNHNVTHTLWRYLFRDLAQQFEQGVQSGSSTISGNVAAISLRALRTEEAFHEIFATFAVRFEELDFEASKAAYRDLKLEL